MPKIVNHEQRVQNIVKVAMQMLSENESLANINMVSIANRCKLSRPTLYQYFHDKEEIYVYAIKNVTNSMFLRYSEIAMKNEPLKAIDKIVDSVISDASEYKVEILALLAITIQAKKHGAAFSKSLYHRTRKFSILLRRLLTQAINNGNLKEDTPVKKVANQIIYFLESACFHVAYFEPDKYEYVRNVTKEYIDFYKPSR